MYQNVPVKYSICQDGSITFEISALLERIVKKGLEYSKKSDGRFDIAIEPVSSLWDFTVKKPTVPDEQKIEKALAYVDYQKIALDDQKLTFQMPGMGIDLGGIAKGFIADELKAYLEKKGVKSAASNSRLPIGMKRLLRFRLMDYQLFRPVFTNDILRRRMVPCIIIS